MNRELLLKVRELLVSLGDYTGNVDARTGIDRCEVVLGVVRALHPADLPLPIVAERLDRLEHAATNATGGGFIVAEELRELLRGYRLFLEERGLAPSALESVDAALDVGDRDTVATSELATALGLDTEVAS